MAKIKRHPYPQTLIIEGTNKQALSVVDSLTDLVMDWGGKVTVGIYELKDVKRYETTVKEVE